MTSPPGGVIINSALSAIAEAPPSSIGVGGPEPCGEDISWLPVFRGLGRGTGATWAGPALVPTCSAAAWALARLCSLSGRGKGFGAI